jgi:hypothetical protein
MAERATGSSTSPRTTTSACAGRAAQRRGRRGGPGVGHRLDRLPTGDRDDRAARAAGGRAGRVHGGGGRAGLLLGVPSQPDRRDRAGRRTRSAERPADRVRRGQPRLAHRRAQAVQGSRDVDPASRPGRGAEGAGEPVRGGCHRGERRGVLRGRRPGPRWPNCTRLLVRAVPSSSYTRRMPSA